MSVCASEADHPRADATMLLARMRELEAENRRLREAVARLESGQIDFTPGSPAWTAAVDAAARRMAGRDREDADQGVMIAL